MNVYQSKRDKTVLVLLIALTLFLCGLYLVSLVFTTGTFTSRFVEAFIMLGMIAFVWSTNLIKYEFKADYLYVRGGIFRSKIPYRSIRKVAIAKSIFVGYRMMNAQEAIEIFYPEGIWGSVKISPDNMVSFITRLKEECPNLKIDSSVYEKYSILYEVKK